MKLIQESAEHHFLTFIEVLRKDSAGWVCFHYALSRRNPHEEMVARLDHIRGRLRKVNQEATDLVAEIAERGAAIDDLMIYQFKDGDVILLARPRSEEPLRILRTLHNDIALRLGAKIAAQVTMSSDPYNLQRFTEARLLAARGAEAYEVLGDHGRVASIPLRRQRREDALTHIVEDDRFTASYAANILNKEYEVVHSRTGEDAIISYIEHAPDIVFLDIHLPGLSGHETLQAIKKVDPSCFVIMLSVDTARENVVNATEFGAAGFLKKPFSKERMLTLVRQSPLVKMHAARRL